MEKGIKKILLLFIVIAALVSGCEKYTLNKIYGFYTLKSYTVDGVDSLSLYKDSLGTDFHFYYEDMNYANVLSIKGYRADHNSVSVICKWELVNNRKTLKIITSYGVIGTGPIGGNKNLEWSISKLRNHRLELKTTYNNKDYIIELENI